MNSKYISNILVIAYQCPFTTFVFLYDINIFQIYKLSEHYDPLRKISTFSIYLQVDLKL